MADIRIRPAHLQIFPSAAKPHGSTVTSTIQRNETSRASFPFTWMHGWFSRLSEQYFLFNFEAAAQIHGRPVRQPLAYCLPQAFAVRLCRFPLKPDRIPAGNRPILTTNPHGIQHTAEFRTGLKENKS